jgi:hypothetical protein
MTAPDIRFRTYLKAFSTDMLTRMSGPLSVPFAVAALLVSSRTQKILYSCLAVVCAMFASYRVWRKERLNSSSQVAEKDSLLSALRDQMALITAKQQKARLKMTVSAEGKPPSQVLKLVANEPVIISRVDYMLSTEATIAGEDVALQGASVEIPINDALLLKVWNTPRADRNNYDHSGPAKIGITASADGQQANQYILPIQMEAILQGSTMYRKIVGSKTRTRLGQTE